MGVDHRCFDVLVAEQVMGWQVETDEPKLRRLQGYFSRDNERRWWRAPQGGWHLDPPSYSTELGVAWQIIAMMNSRGLFLSLSQSSEDYKAAFHEPRAVNYDYVSEKSFPLAICKAALRATAQIQTESLAGVESRITPITVKAFLREDPH